MVAISLSTENLLEQNTDCYAYIVEKDFDTSVLYEATKSGCSNLIAIIEQRKFVGNLQETISVPFSHNGRIAYCIIVGTGDKSSKGINSTEKYRRALGQLIKEVRVCKSTSVAIALSVREETPFYCIEQAVITLQMAQYYFDDYMTEKKRKDNNLTQIVLVVDEKYKEDAERAITEGNIIAKAVNQARHWVDMHHRL